MSLMDHKNTRDPDQKKVMEELESAGICHFCEGFASRHAKPILFENKHWYTAEVTWPYTGSIHHCLIAVKRHVARTTELTGEEWLGMFEVIQWLDGHFKTPGFSLFSRNGDTKYTGATIVHLHFHFLVGGPRPEGFTLEQALPVVLGYKAR